MLNFFNNKIKNLIIVAPDGGVCSQVAFLAYAKYLFDKGYEVKFDLSWYKTCAKSLDGRFSMPYILDSAFPSIKIPIATNEEIKTVKKSGKWSKKKPVLNKIKPPFYIDGYPLERFSCFLMYLDYFKDNFKPINIEHLSNTIQEIENSQSCAIHVRRGDLSTYNPAYGYPIEKEYYAKAIKIAKTFYPDCKFFFFSDEPDWVKKNLTTKEVLAENTYEIIDKNPPEKGYLDLFLISRAKCIISSQGSMGAFGKMLSNKDPLLILAKHDKIALKNLDNCIYINEDTRLNKKYSSR